MTATQSGAAGSKTAPHLSRLEMLDQVGAGRVDSLNKDLAEAGSTTKLEYTPIAPASDDDGGAGDAAAEAAADAAVDGEKTVDAGKADKPEGDIYTFLGEEDMQKRVRVKVDGREQDMVVGDLLKDVQKSRAADKRLEEAALTKKNAEAEAAQILADAREKAGKIKSGGDEVTTDKEQGDVLPQGDAIAASIAKMYEGDPAEAAKELAKAIDATVTQRVKEAQASGTTVDRAQLSREVKTQLEWDVEIEKFSTNHPKIVDDPYLLGRWQSELDAAAKDSSTPQEAIQKATENVETWLEKVSGHSGGTKVSVEEKGDQTNTRRQAKADAKATAVTLTTSVRSAAPSAPKPQMPTDTVAEMKRLRGQT